MSWKRIAIGVVIYLLQSFYCIYKYWFFSASVLGCLDFLPIPEALIKSLINVFFIIINSCFTTAIVWFVYQEFYKVKFTVVIFILIFVGYVIFTSIFKISGFEVAERIAHNLSFLLSSTLFSTIIVPVVNLVRK